MTGSTVTLGPFTGGMVTRADATSIDDKECQIADNFIYDIKGTLVSRPPFYIEKDIQAPPEDADRDDMQALLMWRPLLKNASPVNTLITSSATRTKAFYNNTHEHIEDTYGNQNYSHACLYKERVFFPKIYGVVDSGGWWNFQNIPLQGDGYTRPMQRIPDMPVGTTIEAYKNRLFVAGDPDNPHKLYYSNPFPTGGNGFFPTGQYIEVDPTDGQYITLLVAFADDLLIFKSDSLHYLTYGTGGPNEASIVTISKTIGAESVFAHTVYHDAIYFYHNSRVYSYSSDGLILLNDELWFNDRSVQIYSAPDIPVVAPHVVAPGLTPCLSTWEDCLILSYFGKLFVYNFLAKAWTTWTSPTVRPYQFLQRPRGPYDTMAHYAVSNEEPNKLDEDDEQIITRVMAINSEWTPLEKEDFDCTFVSKVYNFAPGHYSKMFWWGISASTNLQLQGGVKPITLTYRNTWRDIKAQTWGRLKTTTWGNLDFRQAEVVDVVPSDNFGPFRKFYKMLQAMRFKMVVFRVIMKSDGTSINGPQRLHAIIPILRPAATLEAKVS